MRDILTGILSGYGQAYQQHQQNLFQQELERRKQAQTVWQSLAEMPEGTLTPGKREEAFQNLLTYMNTAPGKKIAGENEMFSKFFTGPADPAQAPQLQRRDGPPVAGGPAGGPAGAPSTAAPSPRPYSPFTSQDELAEQQFQRQLAQQKRTQEQQSQFKLADIQTTVQALQKMYPEMDPKNILAIATGHAMPSAGATERMLPKTIQIRDASGNLTTVPVRQSNITGAYFHLDDRPVTETIVDHNPPQLTPGMDPAGSLRTTAVDRFGNPINYGAVRPLPQESNITTTDLLTGQQSITSVPRTYAPPGTQIPAAPAPNAPPVPGAVSGGNAPGGNVPSSEGGRPPINLQPPMGANAPPPGRGATLPAGTTTPTTPAAPPAAPAAPRSGRTRTTPISQSGPVITPEQVIANNTDMAVKDPAFLGRLNPRQLNTVLENAKQRGLIFTDAEQRGDLKELHDAHMAIQQMRELVQQIRASTNPELNARLAARLSSLRGSLGFLVTRNIYREVGNLSAADIAAGLASLPSVAEAFAWKQLAFDKLDTLDSYIKQMQRGYMSSITGAYQRSPDGTISGPNLISQPGISGEQPPAPQNPPPPPGTVPMVLDGVIWHVPLDQVEAAEREGARRQQ